MAAKNSKKAYAQSGKQDTTKNWSTRHLLRLGSSLGQHDDDVGCDDNGDEKMTMLEFLDRLPTAPSTDTATRPLECAFAPEAPVLRPLNPPPPRPRRPDSDVIRDVNAWLEASMIKPGPPLMGGIPYWREAPAERRRPSTDVRYATPIIQLPDTDQPNTPHSQHIKSFCRRAKRMNVRMPSLLRTTSHRITVGRQRPMNRLSNSMPLLSTPDRIPEVRSHTPLSRCESVMLGVTQRPARSRPPMHDDTQRPSAESPRPSNVGWLRVDQRQLLTPSPRTQSRAGVRCREQESRMERHVHAVFGQTSRRGVGMQSPTEGGRIPSEDSMGNLSEAPTYSSGIPPPSYRSRAVSIRTTSSFGCIDARDTERRHVTQRKMVHRCQGVKGKLKRFAQKAHLAK
ncbi:hypothetical protein BCR34DRAFT_583674 [Clohesyomyces aquaticus]|uniref:Uncharacterized protein n=1 Tax=Clohesyomyces aquaticus TaxID=1231657 RepID=A0A1Y2A4W1_9PLEO|nr:hypothetical protein BCR34DRAFT_583674 [Clohesyomyces aquaticus]